MIKIIDDLYAFIWTNPTTNNCNAFLINGEKKILVDPGHYHLFGHVRDHLEKLSLTPDDIDVVVITHCHPDHMEGVRLFSGTSALIALSQTEMEYIRTTAPHYGDALGMPDFEPSVFLQEGSLEIGTMNFQVFQTPGHSPGSICLYWSDEKVLFTGDVVFNQGVGRTDLAGGNGKALKESIKMLSRLDVEYLLPGHGDIITGKERVQSNFSDIERVWFAYL